MAEEGGSLAGMSARMSADETWFMDSVPGFSARSAANGDGTGEGRPETGASSGTSGMVAGLAYLRNGVGDLEDVEPDRATRGLFLAMAIGRLAALGLRPKGLRGGSSSSGMFGWDFPLGTSSSSGTSYLAILRLRKRPPGVGTDGPLPVISSHPMFGSDEAIGAVCGSSPARAREVIGSSESDGLKEALMPPRTAVNPLRIPRAFPNVSDRSA